VPLILQTDFIGNHGDKFTVGGFAPPIVDGVTEDAVEHGGGK